MQGVRRWMTTQPPSNMSRKSHRKTGIKKNDLAGQSKREPEPVKKDSTEYIVSQLMDPKVSDVELRQYEEYVVSLSFFPFLQLSY